MAGPAAVVLAGAVTIWIAIASSDGLVADDYYKRGLAINQVIHREEAAARYGMTARVEPSPGRIRVRVAGGMPRPEALFVQLAHATRAGNDLRLRLAPVGGERLRGGAAAAARRPLAPRDRGPAPRMAPGG